MTFLAGFVTASLLIGLAAARRYAAVPTEPNYDAAVASCRKAHRCLSCPCTAKTTATRP